MIEFDLQFEQKSDFERFVPQYQIKARRIFFPNKISHLFGCMATNFEIIKDFIGLLFLSESTYSRKLL